MDQAASGIAAKYIEQGLLGAAVVALVIAVCLCVRHIIKLYREKEEQATKLNAEKDAIRIQQIADTKIALEAVAKSTDNLSSTEDRMAENNAAMKEFLAVARSLLNKGQI